MSLNSEQTKKKLNETISNLEGQIADRDKSHALISMHNYIMSQALAFMLQDRELLDTGFEAVLTKATSDNLITQCLGSKELERHFQEFTLSALHTINQQIEAIKKENATHNSTS